MRKSNKKGFTIVELVIVIAVIAILSAVLIPTFSGVTQRAQETARDQEARNIYTEYLGNWDYEDGEPVYDCYVVVDEYYYEVEDGEINLTETTINPVGDNMCQKAITDDIITVATHTGTPAEGDSAAVECPHCGEN